MPDFTAAEIFSLPEPNLPVSPTVGITSAEARCGRLDPHYASLSFDTLEHKEPQLGLSLPRHWPTLKGMIAM